MFVGGEGRLNKISNQTSVLILSYAANTANTRLWCGFFSNKVWSSLVETWSQTRVYIKNFRVLASILRDFKIYFHSSLCVYVFKVPAYSYNRIFNPPPNPPSKVYNTIFNTGSNVHVRNSLLETILRAYWERLTFLSWFSGLCQFKRLFDIFGSKFIGLW